MTSETREGPTPNGGTKSVIYYRDDKGNPAEKDVATQAEIVEMNDDDKVVHRTYGTIGKKKED